MKFTNNKLTDENNILNEELLWLKEYFLKVSTKLIILNKTDNNIEYNSNTGNHIEYNSNTQSKLNNNKLLDILTKEIAEMQSVKEENIILTKAISSLQYELEDSNTTIQKMGVEIENFKRTELYQSMILKNTDTLINRLENLNKSQKGLAEEILKNISTLNSQLLQLSKNITEFNNNENTDTSDNYIANQVIDTKNHLMYYITQLKTVNTELSEIIAKFKTGKKQFAFDDLDKELNDSKLLNPKDRWEIWDDYEYYRL